MNKEHYNQIIDWTVQQEQLEDKRNTLEAARLIFKNMGIPLPNGTMEEAAKILATNDYMGWRKCTAKEAQTCANDGTAAMAVKGNEIYIVKAEFDGKDEVATAHCADGDMVSIPSQLAGQEDVQFYSYSAATTLGEAIIIIPGVMGTELELAETVDGFSAGTKVWPPYELGESAGTTAINKLLKLQCKTDGSSKYNIRVRNTNNYGAYNSYKTLYDQLANAFGTKRDVIFFGYDWRNPNAVSGELLRAKIAQYSSVIIVAHSMGGLVASHMLKDTSIQKKVRMLITLGTPFLGSLEMVPVMSHGKFEQIDNAVSNWPSVLAWIAKEVVLQPTLQLVAGDIPSLYELLPTRKFFSLDQRSYYSIRYLFGGNTPLNTFDSTRSNLGIAIKNFNVKLFDAATQRNDSLWNGNTHVTQNVNAFYVIGEGKSTLRTYTYIHATADYSTTSVNSGDGTVLSYSASLNEIDSDSTFFVSESHNGLINSVNHVIQFIKNLINGKIQLTDSVYAFPKYPV